LSDVAGAYYEVVIRGKVGTALSGAVGDLEISRAGPDSTLLYGWFPDQTALQGLLAWLGELDLELSSVRRLPEQR
jgi:hypothetical protein